MTDTELPTVASAIELRDSMMIMQAERTKSMLDMIRRWGLIVLAVVILGFGVNEWQVHGIRATQDAHAKAVQHQNDLFTCQVKAFNGILKDIPLIVTDDQHRADYSPIPKSC